MAITKTKFINYIRCPRYCALEDVKDNELEADVTLDDYRNEEYLQEIQSVIGSMYDDNGESIVDVEDLQLKTMQPYYEKIEHLAANQVKLQFGGNPISSLNKTGQESFDFVEDGVKYLCYVDIFNPNNRAFDIIEVKATTSRKFLELGPTLKGDKTSIFAKDEKGIYRLKEEFEGYNIEEEMTLNKYNLNKAKLMDKYNDCGHYVYDLLVQRMIVENDLRQHGEETKINDIRYYLAVLNAEYVFDGKYDDKPEPVYETDENGNDIIVFFDFTKLTLELMDKIEIDRQRVVKYLKERNLAQCDLGVFCELKKTTKCKFIEPCFYGVVPKKNSILNYIGAHNGFEDDNGEKYKPYDLINDGKVHMLDIPETWLKRTNNIIQREVVATNDVHINYKKIIDGLKQLEYPLYHLDFETFPSPLPRYKGEKCYTQSVFQFSLHVESAPGICDKERDHQEFLAYNHNDLREELVRKLCEYIDTSKGTIIVYNQSFEKTRLKELADNFPEYRNELLKMREMMFDLMNIVQNNSALYKSMGYSDEDASTINYYHNDLNGSFSIKKVLPVFAPELNYNNLDVGNGIEAMVTYATFPNLKEKEFELKYNSLLEYCKQDTWAMVVILDKLRNIVEDKNLVAEETLPI